MTILFSLALCCILSAASQPNNSVQWQFSAGSDSHGEVLLKIKAVLAPGWHIYSQFLPKGGPIPTHFSYVSTPGYTLTGPPEEYGNADNFHDDLYEMDITWYTGTVEFRQPLRLTASIDGIRGKVEYMTCNDHTCIPDTREFFIPIPDQ